MYQAGICSGDKEMSARVERFILAGHRIKVYKYISENELQQELLYHEVSSDILLLDLDDSENHIQLARSIQEENQHIKVIFVTENAMQAADIFEAEPTYLLLKPVCRKKLDHALDKAIQKLCAGEQSELKFFANKKLIRVLYEDIFYVESDKRYLIIYQKNRTDRMTMKLSELVKKLPSSFVRCHQSYVVNINKIIHFEKNEIVLERV